MTTNLRIREIESEIDHFYKAHPFMSQPYSAAIQYLLIIYEEANRLPILLGHHIPLINGFQDLLLIQKPKYSLTHSINWASKIGRTMPERLIGDIEKDIYSPAWDFFNLALVYQMVVSAYTMWSRGIAEAELADDCTVRFKYPIGETRYDMLDSILGLEATKQAFGNAVSYVPYLLKAFSVLAKTVQQTGLYTISYSTREIDNQNMMLLTHELLREQTLPPDNWRFYNIKTEDFKSFWSVLTAICILHRGAMHYAETGLRIKGGAVASTIMVRAKSDWIRQISRWSGLDRCKVEEILEYHTYSPIHKKPDIVLTPFIYVTDKHLALAPTLILTNNLGRNLLKHLAKNFKDEYDCNSHVFEDKMTSDFLSSMETPPYKVFHKVRIPENLRLPDIDVCLVDVARRQAMICEFKWTIPAAEPSEILEKMEIESKALNQLNMLKNYFYEQPESLSNVLKIDHECEVEKFFFVCVMKNCAGTDKMFNKDLPVVNYSIFCKLLNETETLEDAHNKIKERSFLPQENIDFKAVEEEHSVGKFKIIWSGFIPLR